MRPFALLLLVLSLFPNAGLAQEVAGNLQGRIISACRILTEIGVICDTLDRHGGEPDFGPCLITPQTTEGWLKQR